MRIVTDIARAPTLRAVITGIVSGASELLLANDCSLFLLDSSEGQPGWLRLAHCRSASSTQQRVQEAARRTRFRVDQSSIAGACATQRAPIAVADARADPRFNPSVDELQAVRTDSRSILAVPLCDEAGTVVAVLEAGNKHGGGSFTVSDERACTALARVVGCVLARMVLHSTLAREKERSDELARLARTISSASNSMRLGDVVDAVLVACYALLQAERVTVYLLDLSRRHLHIVSTRDTAAAGARVPVGSGLAGACASHNQVVRVADAYADPRFDCSLDDATGFRTHSVLCVPLRDAYGEVVGVIQALNRICDGESPLEADPDDGGVGEGADDAALDGNAVQADKESFPFTLADAEVLATMAAHAAVAMRSAQLLDDMNRQRRMTAALLDIVQTSSDGGSTSGDVMPVLIGKIIDAAYALLDCERVSLHLVDSVKGELWLAVTDDADAAGSRIPIGVGIAGTVAATGLPLNVGDAYEDPRFSSKLDAQTGFVTRSVLAWPISLTPPTSSGSVHGSAGGAISGVIAVLQAINKRSSASLAHVVAESTLLRPQPSLRIHRTGTRGSMVVQSPAVLHAPPTPNSPLPVLSIATGQELPRAGEGAPAGVPPFRRGLRSNVTSLTLDSAAAASSGSTSARQANGGARRPSIPSRRLSLSSLQSNSGLSTASDIARNADPRTSIPSPPLGARSRSVELPPQRPPRPHRVVDLAANSRAPALSLGGVVALRAQYGAAAAQAVDMPPAVNTESRRSSTTLATDAYASASGSGVARFNRVDERVLSVFCAEVAHALKRRSVDAALMKVMADARLASATAAPHQHQGQRSSIFVSSVDGTATTARYRSSDVDVSQHGSAPSHGGNSGENCSAGTDDITPRGAAPSSSSLGTPLRVVRTDSATTTAAAAMQLHPPSTPVSHVGRRSVVYDGPIDVGNDSHSQAGTLSVSLVSQYTDAGMSAMLNTAVTSSSWSLSGQSGKADAPATHLGESGTERVRDDGAVLYSPRAARASFSYTVATRPRSARIGSMAITSENMCDDDAVKNRSSSAGLSSSSSARPVSVEASAGDEQATGMLNAINVDDLTADIVGNEPEDDDDAAKDETPVNTLVMPLDSAFENDTGGVISDAVIALWTWDVFALPLADVDNIPPSLVGKPMTDGESLTSEAGGLPAAALPRRMLTDESTAGELRLANAVLALFGRFQLLERFKIPRTMFIAFMRSVRARYHPHPFHNYFHAVSVTHATALLIATTPAGRMLSYRDILGALLAAYGHDIDHPGHSNGFEVASCSRLAMRHNDDAVLERHHASLLSKLLVSPHHGLLHCLSPADARGVRVTVLRAVLATDMTRHFNAMVELGERAARVGARRRAAAATNDHTVIITGHAGGGSPPRRHSGQPAPPIRLLTRGSRSSTRSSPKVFGSPEPLHAGLVVGCSDDDTDDDEHNNDDAGDGDDDVDNDGDSANREVEERGSAQVEPDDGSAGDDAGVSTSDVPPMSGDDSNDAASTLPYDVTSESDRNELVAALVHTADLSGQAYAPHVATNWSARILKEFSDEANAARALGLPVPHFMAAIEEPLAGARVQLSFVTNVLMPLWQRMAELLPGPAMDAPLANLAAARRLYEDEIAMGEVPSRQTPTAQ